MSEYQNLRSSTIKFCQDFIADLPGLGVVNPEGVGFADLDAHAQLTELPDTDIIGTENFSLITNSPFNEVSLSIAISTVEDKNLFRHHQIVGHLFDRLKPESTFPVVDATTGDELGWFVVTDGTTVMPIAKVNTRSIQIILVSLLTDRM